MRRSATRLVFFALISWGIFSGLTGVIRDYWLLVVDRLLLGVAESLILPSMLILLTNWFTREERSRANAILILGNPVTVTWMAAVTGYLIHAVGWQMTFILEGIPSVLWAFVWIAGGARPAAAGVAGCSEESSAHLTATLALEQTSPARSTRICRACAARSGRARSLRPVFLLELRRLRPCSLDSRDDPLRLVARN